MHCYSHTDNLLTPPTAPLPPDSSLEAPHTFINISHPKHPLPVPHTRWKKMNDLIRTMRFLKSIQFSHIPHSEILPQREPPDSFDSVAFPQQWQEKSQNKGAWPRLVFHSTSACEGKAIGPAHIPSLSYQECMSWCQILRDNVSPFQLAAQICVILFFFFFTTAVEKGACWSCPLRLAPEMDRWGPATLVCCGLCEKLDWLLLPPMASGPPALLGLIIGLEPADRNSPSLVRVYGNTEIASTLNQDMIVLPEWIRHVYRAV